jgi:hypothetical protein
MARAILPEELVTSCMTETCIPFFIHHVVSPYGVCAAHIHVHASIYSAQGTCHRRDSTSTARPDRRTLSLVYTDPWTSIVSRRSFVPMLALT